MAIGGGILGFIVLVLDIWAIITILGSNASPVAKLLWCLLIIFFPLVGLIIWLIAGPRTHAVLS
ncbi:MAG: PLDc N-terminal domain-containing protein [Alphaproteobacteria bacterium]